VMKRLAPGEGFWSRSGGGGGYGPPHEREPERVAFDVAEEYITAEEARDIYGVALDEDGSVDVAATKVLRSRMGKMRIAGE